MVNVQKCDTMIWLSKVFCDEMSNRDMVVELLRPQLEVTKEDVEPIIIMGLYHHRDLVGSSNAFIKGNLKLCRETLYKKSLLGAGNPPISHKRKRFNTAGLPTF